MKRTPSGFAPALHRFAFVEPPPQMERVRNLERWLARLVLLAFGALAIAILAA